MPALKPWIEGLVTTGATSLINSLTSLSGRTGQYSDLLNEPWIRTDFYTYAVVNPLTNGLAIIDAVTPVVGQIWFLPIAGVNAGAWVVTASGPWTRVTDLSTDTQIRLARVMSRNGTGSALNISAEFRCTNTSTITVGTTPITYSLAESRDSAGNINYGFWSSNGDLGFRFFTAGGTTPSFTLQRLSGTNGNVIFNQNGTGVYLFQTGGVVGATLSGGRLRVGSVNLPAAELHIGGNARSSTAWGLSGIVLTVAAATYTDTSTAASGVVSAATMVAFPATTYAATNTSVVITDFYNQYVNRPLTGTNVTATRRWSAGFEGAIQANAFAGNGASPVLAAGAALGTAPNVGVTTGSNVSFSVTTTSGTATTTGVFFTGTFSTAYPTAPRAFITPTTANVAALNLFVTTTTTGFTVSCGTAPAASTAYGIQLAFLS